MTEVINLQKKPKLLNVRFSDVFKGLKTEKRPKTALSDKYSKIGLFLQGPSSKFFYFRNAREAILQTTYCAVI
jgi:hypothetical protein